MSGNGTRNPMLKLMRNGGKVALAIAGPGTVIDWNDIIFKGLTLQGIYARCMKHGKIMPWWKRPGFPG